MAGMNERGRYDTGWASPTEFCSEGHELNTHKPPRPQWMKDFVERFEPVFEGNKGYVSGFAVDCIYIDVSVTLPGFDPHCWAQIIVTETEVEIRETEKVDQDFSVRQVLWLTYDKFEELVESLPRPTWWYAHEST